MYVCICKSINDTKIRKAVQKGRGRLCDLKEDLGVGSQCGQCIDHAQEIVSEEVPVSQLLNYSLNSSQKISS